MWWVDWIDIKEENPPKKRRVLVTDGKTINIMTDFGHLNITHWMPLPGLPGEEDNEDY